MSESERILDLGWSSMVAKAIFQFRDSGIHGLKAMAITGLLHTDSQITDYRLPITDYRSPITK